MTSTEKSRAYKRISSGDVESWRQLQDYKKKDRIYLFLRLLLLFPIYLFLRLLFFCFFSRPTTRLQRLVGRPRDQTFETVNPILSC